MSECDLGLMDSSSARIAELRQQYPTWMINRAVDGSGDWVALHAPEGDDLNLGVVRAPSLDILRARLTAADVQSGEAVS